MCPTQITPEQKPPVLVNFKTERAQTSINQQASSMAASNKEYVTKKDPALASRIDWDALQGHIHNLITLNYKLKNGERNIGNQLLEEQKRITQCFGKGNELYALRLIQSSGMAGEATQLFVENSTSATTPEQARAFGTQTGKYFADYIGHRIGQNELMDGINGIMRAQGLAELVLETFQAHTMAEKAMITNIIIGSATKAEQDARADADKLLAEMENRKNTVILAPEVVAEARQRRKEEAESQAIAAAPIPVGIQAPEQFAQHQEIAQHVQEAAPNEPGVIRLTESPELAALIGRVNEPARATHKELETQGWQTLSPKEGAKAINIALATARILREVTA